MVTLRFGDQNLTDNPYQPTTLTGVDTDNQITGVKRRLARPATALIVMSSIHSVLVSIPLISAIVIWTRGELTSVDVVPFAIGLLQFICLILIAVGGAKMGFLESFTMARLAASLACIPFITPFIFVGIPFGVWSLRLLGDDKVQSAFKRVGADRVRA